VKAVLDHVGIAVRDLDAALSFYRDALGLDVEAPEEVASQRVRAHFIPVGDSSLELLEATASDSAIARYIDKRGPGLHHITLRVDDIDAALGQLRSRGARLIDERPRPGAEGALVAFIHPSSAHGVLVELKQSSVDSRQSSVDSRQSSVVSPQSIVRHRIGELEVISICDASFRLDGGAIFGIVPKVMWAERFRCDEQNRVTLAVRQLIVRGVRTMLIDAGFGDKADERFRQAIGLDRTHNLDHALATAGIAPDDVDIVLATHLHWDHAGGFTARDASGRLRPKFPRARYVVRRGEWEDATRPNERTRGSYAPDDFLPLMDAGVVDFVSDDQTIMPGVTVRRTGGHTMHHQMVLFDSGGQRAAFPADLMPTAAHLSPAWIASVDLFPMETLAAKRTFVSEAVETNMVVFFDHDPQLAAARIVERDGKRSVQPL
jgi:methylmalonyl-CoA epimerase